MVTTRIILEGVHVHQERIHETGVRTSGGVLFLRAGDLRRHVEWNMRTDTEQKGGTTKDMTTVEHIVVMFVDVSSMAEAFAESGLPLFSYMRLRIRCFQTILALIGWDGHLAIGRICRKFLPPTAFSETGSSNSNLGLRTK